VVQEEVPKLSIAERAAMVSSQPAALSPSPTRSGGSSGGGGGALDFAKIEKLRPYQLKAECRKRGLDADGDRDTLMERLKGAVEGGGSGGDDDGSSAHAPADGTATTGFSARAADGGGANNPFARSSSDKITEEEAAAAAVSGGGGGGGEEAEVGSAEPLTNLTKERAKVRLGSFIETCTSCVPAVHSGAARALWCLPVCGCLLFLFAYLSEISFADDSV
jgi:hypothetical protein